MIKNYLIVDHINQYNVLKSSIADNFELIALAPLKKNFKVKYYDENISKKLRIKIISKVNSYIKKIFYKGSKDISVIDGLSFYSILYDSIAMIITHYLLYFYSFKKLLEKNTIIYISETLNPVAKLVLVNLCKKNNNLRVIKLKSNKELTKGMIKIPNSNELMFGRLEFFRDLTFFLKNKKKYLSVFKNLLLIKKSRLKKLTIFLNDSGKLDYQKKYILQNKSNFHWILPFSKKDIKNIFNKDCSFYKNTFYSDIKSVKIKKLIIKILSNCKKNKLDNQLIQFLNLRFFSTFDKFYSLYIYYIEILKKSNPDLILITSDSMEDSKIIGHAATKLSIDNAFLSHGASYHFNKEILNRNFKIKKFLSFGSMEEKGYSDLVYNGKKFVSSHPYFSNFIKKENYKKDDKLKKALVLLPDPFTNLPIDKCDHYNIYLNDVTEVLKSIKIKKISLKARHIFQLQNLNLKNYKIINKTYYGEKNFIEICRKYDLIVGPYSTAFLEASLLGKKYFVYDISLIHKYKYYFKAIDKTCYISKNVKELKNNITNNNIFKKGSSIDSLIYTSNFKSSNELMGFFENKLLKTD